MDILKKGRTVISQKMNNNMIQYSVFAGIVFIIIAHPQTFKLVDSVIKVHNKNILLLVHAVVVSLIMYFGSLYLFIPVQKVLLEGVENGKKKSTWRKNMENVTTEVAEKNAQGKLDGAGENLKAGLSIGLDKSATSQAAANFDAIDAIDAIDDDNNNKEMDHEDERKNDLENMNNKWNQTTVEEIVGCDPNANNFLNQLKLKCLK